MIKLIGKQVNFADDYSRTGDDFKSFTTIESLEKWLREFDGESTTFERYLVGYEVVDNNKKDESCSKCKHIKNGFNRKPCMSCSVRHRESFFEE